MGEHLCTHIGEAVCTNLPMQVQCPGGMLLCVDTACSDGRRIHAHEIINF